MAYTYEQVFAADPSNPSNVAQNASITIFAPGDVSMTPLTITDPDGQPLANPIPVNANGFGSAFAHATLDRVAWAGGGFTGYFTSYEGMKNEAVAAREAAETAAADAGAEAAAAATAAIGLASNAATDSANSAAAAATNASAAAAAAAASAALVGAPADTAIAAAVNGTGTATKAALKTEFGQRPGNRIALLGDSITDNTMTLSGEGTLWGQASGYFTNANQRLNQRFDLVHQTATDPEFGIAGATTASLLADGHVDQLIAANPDVAMVMAGTNDLTNSGTGADTVISGRLVQIFDKIKNAGIPLIVATIPPRLVASDTATVIANHHSVNASIRTYATANRGVILCDWYKVISDPATGRANQTYLGDDVHPNIAGASRMGQFLADLLDPLFPKRPVLPNVGDPKNIAPAGAFTAAHSNSTATVSTVATADLDPRTWTQMAVTAITAADISSYARVLKTTASVTAGDKYQAIVEFQTDAASWNVKGFYLLLKCNGGPAHAVYDGYVVAGSSVMHRPASGVFRTPVLTVPTGTTTLQLEVRQYGVGTTRVRGEGIMKVA